MQYIIIYNSLEVEKEMGQGSEQTNGVYIMRVASMLTGMHPQTLRKYERAGLLEPSRCKKLRMYSDADIARLRTIKHLVDDIGLNLAGVKIALGIQDTILKIRKHLTSADLTANRRKQLLKSLDESLKVLGTVMGKDSDDFVYAGSSGSSKQ
jgi:MerR family transcriptional regulator, heat shock protein HspR